MKTRGRSSLAPISLLFLLLLVPAAASGQVSRKLTLNVRDFGAVGGGKTKDTTAIRQALDRCSVLGGCEVLVPAGEYLTGAVALKSNTTDVPVPVDGTLVHPDKPLEGFSLTNVNGPAAKGISLAHVRNARLRDIKVTGYTGPLVGVHNVTGSGLKGAAAVEAPKLPEPVPATATPYRLR